MSKDTHIVLKKFTSTDNAMPGTVPRGKKFDGTLLNPNYLAGLVKAGFAKKIGAESPAASDSVKKSQGELGDAKSLGALDEPNHPSEDLDEEEDGDPSSDLDEEEDGDPSSDLDEEEEDGALVKQTVISDTPITAEIEAIEKGDKDALKALADKHKSEVRRNLGFDNMKREMLEEFKGK